MKRLKYAVILLLGLSMATIMTSCKKDSGENGNSNGGGGNTYSELIVGRWKATNTWGSHGFLQIHEDQLVVFTADGLTTFPYGEAVGYIIEGDELIPQVNEEFPPYIIDELTSSTLKIEHVYAEGQLVLKKL